MPSKASADAEVLEMPALVAEQRSGFGDFVALAALLPPIRKMTRKPPPRRAHRSGRAAPERVDGTFAKGARGVRDFKRSMMDSIAISGTMKR